MARRVKPLDLEAEVSKILKKIGDDATAVTQASVKVVAKDTVRTLKTTGNYDDITGKYRKSFKEKTTNDFNGATSLVYAKYPESSLTHLLEKGHAIDGGTGRTKAYPHWEPADQKAKKELPELLAKELNKIGK